MQTIVFDVETGPLAAGELSALLPAFEPVEVKLGNLKDPAKIAEKLAEAEASHRRDFFDRAALDPLTGRVVAIGMLVYREFGVGSAECGVMKRGASSVERGDGAESHTVRPGRTALGGVDEGELVILGYDDEGRTLREFWRYTQAEMGRMNPMIGFNIFNFDLPFLFRRSWKHGVRIPFGLRRGRYWGDQLVDLRDAWQLGDRQARGSLDSIARHLGVGAKNGEGKAFAELWRSDRKQAEAYLRNDLMMTARIAQALGVVC